MYRSVLCQLRCHHRRCRLSFRHRFRFGMHLCLVPLVLRQFLYRFKFTLSRLHLQPSSIPCQHPAASSSAVGAGASSDSTVTTHAQVSASTIVEAEVQTSSVSQVSPLGQSASPSQLPETPSSQPAPRGTLSQFSKQNLEIMGVLISRAHQSQARARLQLLTIQASSNEIGTATSAVGSQQ